MDDNTEKPNTPPNPHDVLHSSPVAGKQSGSGHATRYLKAAEPFIRTMMLHLGYKGFKAHVDTNEDTGDIRVIITGTGLDQFDKNPQSFKAVK